MRWLERTCLGVLVMSFALASPASAESEFAKSAAKFALKKIAGKVTGDFVVAPLVGMFFAEPNELDELRDELKDYVDTEIVKSNRVRNEGLIQGYKRNLGMASEAKATQSKLDIIHPLLVDMVNHEDFFRREIQAQLDRDCQVLYDQTPDQLGDEGCEKPIILDHLPAFGAMALLHLEVMQNAIVLERVAVDDEEDEDYYAKWDAIDEFKDMTHDYIRFAEAAVRATRLERLHTTVTKPDGTGCAKRADPSSSGPLGPGGMGGLGTCTRWHSCTDTFSGETIDEVGGDECASHAKDMAAGMEPFWKDMLMDPLLVIDSVSFCLTRVGAAYYSALDQAYLDALTENVETTIESRGGAFGRGDCPPRPGLWEAKGL